MRARTSHSTLGSCDSRSGRGVSVRREVSTGIERGGRGCEGVETPGVAGGVKAGEMIEGGGLCRSWFAPWSSVCSCAGDVWKSKSSFAAVPICGEKWGGNAVMVDVRAEMIQKNGTAVTGNRSALPGELDRDRGRVRDRNRNRSKRSSGGERLNDIAEPAAARES